MAEQKPASAVAAPAASKPSVAVAPEPITPKRLRLHLSLLHSRLLLHPNRLLLLPCLELK